MRQPVVPAFRGYALREIGVARCDALLKELGQMSYARSKRARAYSISSACSETAWRSR